MAAFVKTLEASLEQTEAHAAQSRADDGSGLGRNSLVTPQLVTKLLQREYASPDRELWVSLLPVGGEDGTLEHRLCCVFDGSAIRAKTGTLGRAIALSGYANSKSSGWLAFSILVNDFSAPSGEVRAWIDKIALALVE
jgi:D-alanyl-D-alanine carboxypeptidase/D-alanyl-D-alanine-endopeptidase (penicillin-binding protein 4)